MLKFSLLEGEHNAKDGWNWDSEQMEVEGYKWSIKIRVKYYVNRNISYVSCRNIVLNQSGKHFVSNHNPSISCAAHCDIQRRKLVICAKHLTLSRMTSLFLNWRDMDLIDGPLAGYGIGWIGLLHSKSCGQQLDVQVETSDEWCSSRVSIGTGAV